jgi:hypothetical protein
MDVLFGIILDVLMLRWVNRETNPYRKVLVVAGFILLAVAIVVIL